MTETTKAPKVLSHLRQDIVKMPKAIWESSGIDIYGRLIRAVVFTTDVAIIANTNADAVLAVYPFTPSPAIIKSIMAVANVPVFAGVGGGLTSGQRSANMSLFFGIRRGLGGCDQWADRCGNIAENERVG